jgi:hypothetical protein
LSKIDQAAIDTLFEVVQVVEGVSVSKTENHRASLHRVPYIRQEVAISEGKEARM